MSADLKKIIFEDINENYGYGKYGEFEVIIDKRTGYINATKLCTDGGKEFRTWIRYEHGKRLLEAYSRLISSGRYHPELLEKNMTGDYRTRGTYVQPDLIPHIASWVSPEFAYKVSKIVNEHIVKEYHRQIYKLQQESSEKDTKINELTVLLNRMNNKLDVVIDDNKETHHKLNETHQELKKTHHKLDEVKETAISTFKVLEKVATQRVPFERVPRPEEHQLIIFYTDGSQEKPYRICTISAGSGPWKIKTT